jgi:hypothetical protein
MNKEEKMRIVNLNTKLVPKIVATHNSYKSNMMQNKFTTNENYNQPSPTIKNHNENFDAQNKSINKMEDEGKSKLNHGMPIAHVFYLCTPSPTHHKLQANNIGGS